MTTPINTFENILDAMERDPALRDALRRHILTDELLQMPLRLEKVHHRAEGLQRGYEGTLVQHPDQAGPDGR